jgi:hypothetical protein
MSYWRSLTRSILARKCGSVKQDPTLGRHAARVHAAERGASSASILQRPPPAAARKRKMKLPRRARGENQREKTFGIGPFRNRVPAAGPQQRPSLTRAVLEAILGMDGFSRSD